MSLLKHTVLVMLCGWQGLGTMPCRHVMTGPQPMVGGNMRQKLTSSSPDRCMHEYCGPLHSSEPPLAWPMGRRPQGRSRGCHILPAAGMSIDHASCHCRVCMVQAESQSVGAEGISSGLVVCSGIKIVEQLDVVSFCALCCLVSPH